MNFLEEYNLSSYADFYLCKGHSKKTDKDYYCICLKIDYAYFPIKFLNQTQYESLRKED